MYAVCRACRSVPVLNDPNAGDAERLAALLQVVMGVALYKQAVPTGLPPERVEVLGALPVYTTGTAFLVTPVVGLVQPGFVLQPNPHEVDDVFEVPLDFLMNPANHRRHALEWEGARREWYSMPYHDTTPGGALHSGNSTCKAPRCRYS